MSVGVTLIQRASTLGVRIPRYGTTAQVEEEIERKIYAAETGRDPDSRFTGGIAKAQWEYGLRGTDYWTKDAREAVRLLSAARS